MEPRSAFYAPGPVIFRACVISGEELLDLCGMPAVVGIVRDIYRAQTDRGGAAGK